MKARTPPTISVTRTMIKMGITWADWSSRRLKGSINIRSNRLRMEILLPVGVPALSKVGLFGFEYLSQLFDAFFHLRGITFGDFKHERCSPAKVQRNKRLQ